MKPCQVVDAYTANPCEDRWQNMANDMTSRMWGLFDETGMFVCLCRHGFVLIVADMVQSGELAKYPLAVLEFLLTVLEEGLGVGYDCGCKLSGTIHCSLLGPLARAKGLKCLVGLFHGHAHCRLCQVRNLGTYVDGLGIEDLEGCERCFSKTNELAGSYRHASAFHRQQSLHLYFEHLDEVDTAESISTFLVNNYKQALDVLKTASEATPQFPPETDFRAWLDEEYEYLSSRKATPPEEEWKMEYYKKLVDLTEAESVPVCLLSFCSSDYFSVKVCRLPSDYSLPMTPVPETARPASKPSDVMLLKSLSAFLTRCRL